MINDFVKWIQDIVTAPAFSGAANVLSFFSAAIGLSVYSQLYRIRSEIKYRRNLSDVYTKLTNHIEEFQICLRDFKKSTTKINSECARMETTFLVLVEVISTQEDRGVKRNSLYKIIKALKLNRDSIQVTRAKTLQSKIKKHL